MLRLIFQFISVVIQYTCYLSRAKIIGKTLFIYIAVNYFVIHYLFWRKQIYVLTWDFLKSNGTNGVLETLRLQIYCNCLRNKIFQILINLKISVSMLNISNQKQLPEVFCKKRCSEKCSKTYRKTPVSESLFIKVAASRTVAFLKRESETGFFMSILRNFPE